MIVTATAPESEADIEPETPEQQKRRKIRAFLNTWNAGRATRGTIACHGLRLGRADFAFGGSDL